MRFFCLDNTQLPVENGVGRLYRGEVNDDTLPTPAVVTWENKVVGNTWQLFGHRSEVYANQKLKITFMIKFVQKMPPTGQVALKVYGILHYH